MSLHMQIFSVTITKHNIKVRLDGIKNVYARF